MVQKHGHGNGLRTTIYWPRGTMTKKNCAAEYKQDDGDRQNNDGEIHRTTFSNIIVSFGLGPTYQHMYTDPYSYRA